MNTVSIAQRCAGILENIETIQRSCDRDSPPVSVVCVSKTRTTDDIAAAYAAGMQHMGENYLQEALPKIAALTGLGITWHFIGALQSNKLNAIAEHFQWVHTLDNLRHAQRLNAACGALGKTLDVCLQVNWDHEPHKAGVDPADVAILAQGVAALPHLRLRGLMCIPRATHDAQAQRNAFFGLAQAQEALNLQGFYLDTLSMGMSHDYAMAIECGATMVRIGTAIFGPR